MTAHTTPAPRCWHCNGPLAKRPKLGYYATIYKSPSGPVMVHSCCLKDAQKANKNPHLWPATEVRSETYR